MNQAASHLATREEPERLYNMEGFYIGRNWAGHESYQQNNSPIGGGGVSCQSDWLPQLPLGGRGREPMWQVTSLLIGTYQGIPDWTIKVIFQEGVETAFRSGILGTVSSALAQVTPCWACVFLFNSSNLFPGEGASHVNIWGSVFSTERRASTEILRQEHAWSAPVGEDKECSFYPSKCRLVK